VKVRPAAVALIPLLTAASYLAGALVDVPLLVPVLNTAVVFPFMVSALRRGETTAAIGRMLVWAASLAICSTALAYLAPDRTATLFINGDAYRREMFGWVWTGAGRESDPSRFIPNHLFHAALFSVLSLATGSILSMPMGALLMNYMGHYVGALAAVSGHPARTIALAWVPWAIVRIVSFVALGVVLGGPVLSRLRGFPYRLRDHRRTIWIAAAGLLADILLKALLAPAWQRWLRATL
jgi:hypothetical protein